MSQIRKEQATKDDEAKANTAEAKNKGDTCDALRPVAIYRLSYALRMTSVTDPMNKGDSASCHEFCALNVTKTFPSRIHKYSQMITSQARLYV